MRTSRPYEGVYAARAGHPGWIFMPTVGRTSFCWWTTYSFIFHVMVHHCPQRFLFPNKDDEGRSTMGYPSTRFSLSWWVVVGGSMFKQIAIFYCQWRLIHRLSNLWFPWATHKLWSGWDSCALCHGKTQRCLARPIQQIIPCTLWKPRRYPGQINWHSKD